MKRQLLSVLLLLVAMLEFPAVGQNREQVSNGKITPPKNILGIWELWIPGAATYSATETSVYRHYTPGSSFNQLEINTDGSYKWGNHSGRLKEVIPWHAMEGRRYFRISDMRANEYDFWHDASKDQLTVLFGEVGGHAATGTRLSGHGKSISLNEDLPMKESGQKFANEMGEMVMEGSKSTHSENISTSYKAGDIVEIEWKGQWYKGAILEIGDHQLKVSYDGWGSLYDEWVSPSRVRKPG